MRKRKRLEFNPVFEGPYKIWAYRFAKKNLWRVYPAYDMEDLMHDAYVKFLHCKRRYTPIVPKKFTALFKTAFTRHLHDLSYSVNAIGESELDGIIDIDALAALQEHANDVPNNCFLTISEQVVDDLWRVSQLAVDMPAEAVLEALNAVAFGKLRDISVLFDLFENWEEAK